MLTRQPPSSAFLSHPLSDFRSFKGAASCTPGLNTHPILRLSWPLLLQRINPPASPLSPPPNVPGPRCTHSGAPAVHTPSVIVIWSLVLPPVAHRPRSRLHSFRCAGHGRAPSSSSSGLVSPLPRGPLPPCDQLGPLHRLWQGGQHGLAEVVPHVVLGQQEHLHRPPPQGTGTGGSHELGRRRLS